MSDTTSIEWTDATWNPITGCSVHSPGCTNCYAMLLAGTRLKNHPSREGLTRETGGRPKWTGEVRFNMDWLDLPLRWKRPRRIFVCAHGDLFHESVPDEWIDRVFAVMALCPQHTFQVLTKRAARMREYLTAKKVVKRICTIAADLRISTAPDPKRWPKKFHARLQSSAKFTAWVADGGIAATIFNREEPNRDWPSWVCWPLPNVWLGVSVEDQQRADERIPDLLNTPAAVRWLSCEPLLGIVDLTRVCLMPKTPGSGRAGIHLDALSARYCEAGTRYIGDWDVSADYPKNAPSLSLDWVVVGGESGPGARPIHPDWARSLRDQCAGTGVPFFFKQWGAHRPTSDCQHGEYMIPASKKEAGRLLDGVEHNAEPLQSATLERTP